MKKLAYTVIAFVTAFFIIGGVTIQAQTSVDQWGFLGGRQGNWIFTPGDAPGGGSIGGNASLSVEWGAIRGGFVEPVTATTDKAILVTGNIEFVGAGIDTWSGLRYGLFMHDAAGTLITTNVDSTRWSGSESSSHGYMFTPVSGTQRVTDGASGGVGTQWIRISGNYISTSTGSGPVYSGGVNLQKPARAVADAGKYSFAFSVQPLADGTKEVRFYLIKGDVANSATSSYYFAGSFIDTSSIAPTFNGVVFAVHATGSGPNPNLRGVKLTDVKVDVGTPFELPEAPWQAYYVDQWGFLGGRQGNWSFKPDPEGLIGNAGIGGDASLSVEWGAIRGGFIEPVTATTDKAILVTGNIEFEGAGIDTWSGLRYGLFMHDSAGTLITSNVDSTRWSGSESYSHGYMFTPVSGTQRVTDGASGGVGTQWVRISGNYISTSTGSGPVYSAGVTLQNPARAVADAGKYSFAFSVQPLANGTKEVRFYLIKGDVANSAKSTYYFGGSFIDTSSIAPTFNGVVFAVHATGSGPNPNLRGVKLTDVKVDVGTPFELPEAPWQAYYVDQWGFLGGRQGNWSFKPDPEGLIGNAGIGGDASLSVEWGAIRGGFIEPVTATTDKAILVTGNIEFVGAGIDTWSGLRYGLFMHDAAGTLITTNVDSTRWSGSESSSHGYMFTPVSGTQRVTDGASGGVGTQWVRISGNYISTSTGSGPVYSAGVTLQNPARAVADAGKYSFAFSVQPLANGTKEVRFYLIKGDVANSAKSTYYFGGSFIDTSSIAPTFNGVVFAVHATGSGPNPDLRGVTLTDVKVDLGTPFELPEAPFQAFYVNTADWGFIGARTGGWELLQGGVDGLDGNVTIKGANSLTDWSAVRGGFLVPVTPPSGKALVVTGSIEFEGGGFEASNSLRFGLFYSDSAGVVDSTDIGYAWTGTEAHHSGYLFSPRSGTNPMPTWAGTGQTGTWGAVVDGTWLSTDGANNYILGSDVQSPSGAVAGAGTYDFSINVAPKGDGTQEVSFTLMKRDGTYGWTGLVTDNHDPLTTRAFNSIAFALNANASTKAMNVKDVKINLGTPIPVSVDENSTRTAIPTEFTLQQNYPNPFNPTTTIEFGLPKRSEVKLVIYDLSGRVVTELAAGNFDAGYHSINFDAVHLASGVYYYKLKAGDFVSVKKLMLLK